MLFRDFSPPFNKVFSAAPLYRLLRFAHGFVFAPQIFFFTDMQEDCRRRWWRGCLPRPKTQTKKPRDESRGFRKWRLPTLPRYSAVQYHRRCWVCCPLRAALPRPSAPALCLAPRPLRHYRLLPHDTSPTTTTKIYGLSQSKVLVTLAVYVYI